MSVPIAEWSVDGWRIKTSQGRHQNKDRKVLIAAPDVGFCAVSFAAVATQVRLLYDNEELLHPRSAGKLGGEKVLLFLRDACSIHQEIGGLAPIIQACRRHSLPLPKIAIEELQT